MSPIQTQSQTYSLFPYLNGGGGGGAEVGS